METMAGSSLSSYSDDSSSSSDGVDSLHPFNELVLDTSRSIDDDTFDQVKILCWRVVPDQKLEKLKKPHELIIELYNMGKITDTNVRYLINIFKKLNLPPLVEKLRNYQKRNQDTTHSLQSRRSKSLPDIEKILGRGYFEITANLDLSPEQCLEYRSATMMLLTEVQSILAKNCKDQRQRLDEVFRAHQVYIKQIINSSIVVVLVCKSYSALISFKEGVTSGNLGNILTDILVTDEIRSILEGSVIDPHIVINVDQSCFEKAEQFFKTMQDKISLAARVRQVEKIEKHCVSVAPLNLMVRKSSSKKSLSRFRELVKVVQKICAERRQLAKKVSDQSLTLDVLHSSYDRVTAQAVKIGDCLLELSISGRHSESMMRLSQQVGWSCLSCSKNNTPMREMCVQCGTPRPQTYSRPVDHVYLASLEKRLDAMRSDLLLEKDGTAKAFERIGGHYLSPSDMPVKEESSVAHLRHGIGEVMTDLNPEQVLSSSEMADAGYFHGRSTISPETWLQLCEILDVNRDGIRDWKGFADHLGLTVLQQHNLERKGSPTSRLLSFFCVKSIRLGKMSLLKELQNIFDKIGNDAASFIIREEIKKQEARNTEDDGDKPSELEFSSAKRTDKGHIVKVHDTSVSERPSHAN